MNWWTQWRQGSAPTPQPAPDAVQAERNAKLAQAVFADRLDAVQAALAEGASPEVPFVHPRRQTWRTPLQHAVLSQNAPMVSALLAAGANPLHTMDQDTFPPVLLAIIEEHVPTVRALQAHGVDWHAPVPGPFGDPISAYALVQLRNRPAFANWFCEEIAPPPKARSRPRM